MNHKQIEELLPLYIDHSLTDQEEKLIKSHLQNCEDCQEKLKKYKENHELLATLTAKKAPANFTESILNKINEDTESKQTGNRYQTTILQKIKNFFTLQVRVPAGIIAVIAVIFLLSFTGLPEIILQNNQLLNMQTENELADSQQQNYNQEFLSAPDTQSSLNKRMKASESLTFKNDNQDTDSLNTQEQKIIKRANLIIELSAIDTIDNNLINLIKEYNGYISNSRNWYNQNKQKFYWFELKVPAANFEQVLNQLTNEKYGMIISRSISSQDVTEEYMDLDISLDNLLSQEERYRQLIDKATEVEEILQIENELNRIRTEIERLQGRKKYLDNQISYSTITVEFRQPEPINSGTPGIIKAIKNATNKMIDQFYKIIILIGTITPYIVLLAIGYMIYRKRNNK